MTTDQDQPSGPAGDAFADWLESQGLHRDYTMVCGGDRMWAAFTGGLRAGRQVGSEPVFSDDVHVDWHMTPGEWRQLYTALWAEADENPYIARLIEAGKIPAPFGTAKASPTEAAADAAVKRAVAATYRHLAIWMDAANADEALRVAGMVERYDETDICCPCCQEVECDSGCPLEPVRAGELA